MNFVKDASCARNAAGWHFQRPTKRWSTRRGGHVVLSCITQAHRLGLWVRDKPGRYHVAAHHPHARAPRGTVTVHWNKPLILREPYILADPPENMLQCVAACQPRESALVIWESALNKRIVDYARLVMLPLSGAARRLLEICTPFSESGLESLVVDRLGWIRIEMKQQIYLSGHRIDVLIGERLVVQTDGASHTGAQRDIDNLHDSALKDMGYHVMRFSYHQVMHQWEVVQWAILQAVARGAHQA